MIYYPNAVDIELLQAKHPEVVDFDGFYEMVDDLLEGGEKLRKKIDKYLVRKPGEDEETYKYRKRLFTYTPILSEAVNELLNKFSSAIHTVDGLPKEEKKQEFWQKFRQNVDSLGSDENSFIRKLLLNLLKYRRIFILIDQPKRDTEPRNKLEEEQLGFNPYLVQLSPTQVIHWYEEEKQLQWVKLQQIILKHSPFGEDKLIARWTFFDELYTTIYEAEVERDREGKLAVKHKNPSEPQKNLVKLLYQYEHGYEGIPIMMAEIPAHLWVTNLSIFLTLEHIRIHNNLTFAANIAGIIQRLFRPIMETADQTLDMEEVAAQIKVGNETVLIGNDFKFAEVSGSSISSVGSYLDRLESRIKDLVFSNGLSNAANRPMQESGKAKEMDFANQDDALKTYGQIIQNLLQRTYRKLGLVVGLSKKEVEKISINGLSEFQLNSADGKIERITRIQSLGVPIPQKVMKTLLYDLSTALVPTFTTQEQEEVVVELEQLFEVPDQPELSFDEATVLWQQQLISDEKFLESIGYGGEVLEELTSYLEEARAEQEQQTADLMLAQILRGIGGDKEAEVAENLIESNSEYLTLDLDMGN